MKTLIERTCDFIVYVTDNDKDIMCGKPAVEKVHRAHGSGWLCAEHFELVSYFRSLMKEQ
jgi:hypothetical protein